jgi:methylenetetrahydrofolate reductase (NADPH)
MHAASVRDVGRCCLGSQPVAAPEFQVIVEIEPATQPDLTRVRHQIGVWSTVADGFLVPDNHIGRATVSSIAVAHEVALMGGRAIACVNARDRNVLGFRRDLLTAAAYGVEEFLFVHGDRPESGSRSDDLTVRAMLDEVRTFGAASTGPSFAARVGVTTRLRRLPEWKRSADFLLVQVGFSVDELVAWRSTLDFDGPVFAGVMVVASPAMARKLSDATAELAVPDWVVERVTRDPDAGVEIALDLIEQIRASGAFAGVHVVPVSRYRQLAARMGA